MTRPEDKSQIQSQRRHRGHLLQARLSRAYKRPSLALVIAVVVILSVTTRSARGLSSESICETVYYKTAEAMTTDKDLQLAIAWRLRSDDCDVQLHAVKSELKEAQKALKAEERKAKTQRGFLAFSLVLAGCLVATVSILGALR